MMKNRIVVREKSANENRTFVLFSCLHLYTFKKMSDIIGTVTRTNSKKYDRTGAWYHQVFPSAVLSANISFPTGILRNVTFIRNEVRNTSIHYKNELFVTNLDTNFWLIMIIVKVTNGGIYHECRKRTFAIR